MYLYIFVDKFGCIFFANNYFVDVRFSRVDSITLPNYLLNYIDNNILRSVVVQIIRNRKYTHYGKYRKEY